MNIVVHQEVYYTIAKKLAVVVVTDVIRITNLMKDSKHKVIEIIDFRSLLIGHNEKTRSSTL